eukprot:365651-Pyramimonas_sp.AAC.1
MRAPPQVHPPASRLASSSWASRDRACGISATSCTSSRRPSTFTCGGRAAPSTRGATRRTRGGSRFHLATDRGGRATGGGGGEAHGHDDSRFSSGAGSAGSGGRRGRVAQGRRGWTAARHCH